MKRFSFIFAIAAAVLAVASCKKEVEDALTFKSSEILFANAGGSQTVAFESNVEWTAAADQDWLTLSKTSGEAGTASITITAAKNESFADRTGKVTVTAGTKTTVFNVKQTEEKVFSAGTVNVVSPAAQTVSIKVLTNESFNATVVEGADWLKVASTKAAPAEATITVEVSSNTGLIAREGKIAVATASEEFTVAITQESNFVLTETVAASYLGNSQNIYNAEIHELTRFGQFALTLENNTDEVRIAFNVPKATADKTALPTGTFTCDYEAAHAENTFSLKDLEGKEKFYTTVLRGTSEIEIVDGEVEVSKEGDTYTVVANLMDAASNILSYVYIGKIESIADQSIGIEVSSIRYLGDYSTYFANDNSEWSVLCYISEPIAAGMPLLYSLSFNLFDGKGIVADKSLPTGKFTLNKEENYIESAYASGTRSTENKTFDASEYNYADYDFETKSYSYVKVNDGSIEISKNSDGTYNLAFDLKCQKWSFDDNYDVVNGDAFDWKYTFKNVTMPEPSDDQLRPQPDEDKEFSGNVSVNPAYMGYWYGNTYGLGGNVFMFGWSAGVDGHYTVYLPVHSKSAWAYVTNYAGRFCAVNVPNGTYNWVGDLPTENSDFICNVKMAARAAYIKNGYTGTTAYINGGSVTISANGITFDVTAAAGGKTYKFTGTLPNQVSYFQNYSGANRQSQMAWKN